MFRLPYTLGPQIAPTAEVLSLQGGRAVYTTQWTCGYPTRTVVSLRVRTGQLTRWDFHPLDYGLVGRSPGRLCPVSNHKNIEIARYSFNFCDLRSNKFDPNLCAYLRKLIRPRSLSSPNFIFFIKICVNGINIRNYCFALSNKEFP